MSHTHHDAEYDDRFDDPPLYAEEPEDEPYGPDDLTQADRDRAADEAAERAQP